MPGLKREYSSSFSSVSTKSTLNKDDVETPGDGDDRHIAEEEDEHEFETCCECCGRCLSWCWWEGEYERVDTGDPAIKMLRRRDTRCCRFYRCFICVVKAPFIFIYNGILALVGWGIGWVVWGFVMPALVLYILYYVLIVSKDNPEAIPLEATDTTIGITSYTASG